MEEADGVVRKESEEEYDVEQRFPRPTPYSLLNPLLL